LRWSFAQREAVEAVIRLCDAKRARDKFDLLRKTARLAQWCADATAASWAELVTMFREYQDAGA
jgi:hypothetical protein